MSEHRDGICPLCGAEIEYDGSYDYDDDGPPYPGSALGAGRQEKPGMISCSTSTTASRTEKGTLNE